MQVCIMGYHNAGVRVCLKMCVYCKSTCVMCKEPVSQNRGEKGKEGRNGLPLRIKFTVCSSVNIYQAH